MIMSWYDMIWQRTGPVSVVAEVSGPSCRITGDVLLFLYLVFVYTTQYIMLVGLSEWVEFYVPLET